MNADGTGGEEIRRFEEQYRRNPDSLVFARLADAHRKAGDFDRALSVLQDGIARHPDYASAHIVRARALSALERPAEAEESLRRALELDGQNLVAMRELAGLAEKRGDPAEAVHWFKQLASLDPLNAEAASELERLREIVPDTRPGLEPLPAPSEEWWSSPAFELSDGAPTERVSEESEEAAADPEEAADDPDAAIEDAGIADLDDLAMDEDLEAVWGELEAVADDETDDETDEGTDEGTEEAVEVVDEAAEIVDEPMDGVTVVEASEVVDVEETSSAAGQRASDPGAAAWWFEDPSEEEPSEDGDLLTRTMAELYVKQGLFDEAAAIYRELVEDRPDDEELRQALSSLEEHMRADVDEPEEDDEPQEMRETEPEPAPVEAHVAAETVVEVEAEAAAETEVEESVAAAAAVVADPYATHPVPVESATSEVFREWIERLRT